MDPSYAAAEGVVVPVRDKRDGKLHNAYLRRFGSARTENAPSGVGAFAFRYAKQRRQHFEALFEQVKDFCRFEVRSLDAPSDGEDELGNYWGPKGRAFRTDNVTEARCFANALKEATGHRIQVIDWTGVCWYTC